MNYTIHQNENGTFELSGKGWVVECANIEIDGSDDSLMFMVDKYGHVFGAVRCEQVAYYV